MPRSLVIGASGFIGSHLVRRLVARGEEVHVVLRESTRLDRLAALSGRIAIHRADLADRPALNRCLAAARPEQVFHLAADTRDVMAADPGSVRRSFANVANLVNLVEGLSRLPSPPRVVVRASTIAEYGHAMAPFREDGPITPINPYGASMAAGTHYLGVLAPSLPFPVATARLALAYGPGQPESYFVAACIAKCLAGERLTIAHPRDRRDLIYVDDAVDGILALAEAGPPETRVVNIATGVAPRMREVAERIMAATGADPGLLTDLPQPADGPVSELVADPARARTMLGWQAAIPWAEGIERTVAQERATTLPPLRKAL